MGVSMKAGKYIFLRWEYTACLYAVRVHKKREVEDTGGVKKYLMTEGCLVAQLVKH